MKYGIIFILSIIVAKSFSTLLHELGHATAALITTRGKVKIFVGTMGDVGRSIHLPLGRLSIYFRYNFLNWMQGLCQHSDEDLTYAKNFFITLMGPIASLMVATVTFWLTFLADPNPWIVIVSFFLFVASAMDFFYSIVPSPRLVRLHDGSYVHNDGYQLLKMRTLYKRIEKYRVAAALLAKQDYAGAFPIYREEVENGVIGRELLSATINLGNYLQEYEFSAEVGRKFDEKYDLGAEELLAVAYSFAQLGKNDEFIAYMDRILALDPSHLAALQNKAYIYNLLGQHEEALAGFENVIELDEANAYSWSGLGLAKMNLGQMEEGLADIEKALELDPNSTYAIRNLGIYQLKKGNYREALAQFERAVAIGIPTHLLEEYLEEAKAKLAEA